MKIQLSTEKKHEISPYLYMQFAEPLGTADSSIDAGWDYFNDKWHDALLDIVKELSPTMIRWGGCFASFYRWKEAVGPRDKRIPMINYCWDGIYSNQVGTHEIVELCRHVNAEPLMVVNMESDGRMHWAYPKTGEDRFGTAEEAAEWIDYCNNPDNKLRKEHGISEPYNIKFWQIGNETSYDHRGYDCEKASEVTLKFAKKMRSADKDIKLIAWGDSGWAPRMLEVAGEEIDYISFHHHFDSGLPDSPLRGTEYRKDPEKTWTHLMHAYKSLENKISEVRSQVEPYGKRLAMTEGHFAIPGRNRCEVLSSWGAGVAYARCLLTIEKNSDIIDIATMADFFGNRWQVNAVMLPTPMRDGKPYLQPVGEVMKLFRHHIGDYAVDVKSANSSVDIAASITGNKLYLHLANTSMSTSEDIEIEVPGYEIVEMTAYEISSDPTVEITGLNIDVFKPVEKKVAGKIYNLPAASVSAVEIEIKEI